MNRLLPFALFILFLSPAFAQVRLARLFSDHVVLQRQQVIPVWGWAKPGETVRVTLAGQTGQAKADASGKWTVRLTPLEAGGPHELVASAKSGQAKAADVLIGEVWLCSGQSNMEWPVKQADNYENEKRNASFGQIRHFRVEHELALTPETDLKTGDWKVCSPETVGDFTAVGFFFARELTQKLGVPVGLLHSSWGGSQAEGWISKEGMLTNNDLRPMAQTLPTNWQQADSLVDYKLRKQLLKEGSLTPTVADEARYLTANFDISGWRASDPFGQWDWKGMSGFRGTGFMARQIEIPAAMVGTTTTLALAENDSPNEIYINGQRVAEGTLTGVRKLTLPANTWKPGTNLLMIKFGNAVRLPWFGLGLQGSPNDLYVAGEQGKISLANGWRIMPSFAETHTYTRFMNNLATGLYNAMIHPLVPFGIRGALWYQGETNAGRAYQYRQTFPLVITDWRKKWGYAFPFYFVQLSSYGANQNSNQGSNWAELREAQTLTLSLPQTGMAVTTDVGNPNDIHPTNKQDVGHRLAVIALKQDYGQAGPDGSPLYQSLRVDGNKAIVSFQYANQGLMTKDKYGYVRGFEMAGDDKVFHPAQAQIQGSTVVVSSPQIAKPVAVRYGWADAPVDANLFSIDGFPVSPFRTDAWPGITEKNKFE
ncbi:sialate O-acetylesterase [Rudanella lutea]|uniref:sialate O-acetylesterase n=1 Tax=Rudanella lutea TaxID=451374 RepID=UPI0003629927|nr:sialate O-acetylesterase [Rudanella lutea]